MKILIPISGAAGIFFPIGKPPKGTCEFSTKFCLKYCTALKDKPYDEEYRVLESLKRKIYKFFITEKPLIICAMIIQEMSELRTEILHWFVSGDCLPKDQGKILSIIKFLDEGSNIVQLGFTRNEDLWHEIPHDLPRINFILTCEKVSDIPLDRDRMIYAVPEPDSDLTDLYITKQKEIVRYGGCGGTYIDYENYPQKMTALDIIHDKRKNISPTNCSRCYRLKQGCFYEK